MCKYLQFLVIRERAFVKLLHKPYPPFFRRASPDKQCLEKLQPYHYNSLCSVRAWDLACPNPEPSGKPARNSRRRKTCRLHDDCY